MPCDRFVTPCTLPLHAGSFGPVCFPTNCGGCLDAAMFEASQGYPTPTKRGLKRVTHLSSFTGSRTVHARAQQLSPEVLAIVNRITPVLEMLLLSLWNFGVLVQGILYQEALPFYELPV